MTEAQELYCQSVSQGLSSKLAASAAGLNTPPNSPEVKARISMLKEILAETLGIDKAYILQGFKDAVATAENSMEMISGYREMGKMLGFYEPIKHEVTVTTGSVAHLSNERLLELADMSDVIDGEYHLVDFEDE